MKRSILGLAVVAFLNLAVPVEAATLFDNGAAYGGNPPNIRFDYRGWAVLDDFVLAKDSLVTGFRWSQFEEPQTVYSSTTLMLFNGVPQPSTLIGSISSVASRTANGLVIDVPSYVPFTTSNELFGFDYVVSGQSIGLSAGTYFLGIHNDVSEGVTLSANSLGGSNSINGFYQHTYYDGDDPYFGLSESTPLEWNSGYTAFRVEGTAVPAPSSLVCLVGVGIMVCGIEWWRKRRR